MRTRSAARPRPSSHDNCHRNGSNNFVVRDHLRNHLKRQHDITPEDCQPRPNSRARTERETSVTSGTNGIEDSRLSVAGQTPHVATTDLEISPDRDRDIFDRRAMESEEGLKTTENVASQTKALECENRSLKEQLQQLQEQRRDHFHQRHNITEDFVYRKRILESKIKRLEEKSCGLEEQLKTAEHLAKEYTQKSHILEEELETAKSSIQKQCEAYHQEAQKCRDLEEELKTARDCAQIYATAFLHLKQELETENARTKASNQETLRELEEQMKFAEDLIIQNDSTTYGILSLGERLETAEEQNRSSGQKIQKLREKQLILESKIQLLTKELEAAQNRSHQIQNLREIQLMKPFTSLNGALVSSAMDCRCGRCVIGLHCSNRPRATYPE